eukprot:scaffold23495_cov74-Cyclotella_meneghiniana.AAC.3
MEELWRGLLSLPSEDEEDDDADDGLNGALVSCLHKMRSSSRKRRMMTRTTWMKRRRSCCYCYCLQVQSDRLLNRQGRIAFTGSTLLRIGPSVIQLNNVKV